MTPRQEILRLGRVAILGKRLMFAEKGWVREGFQRKGKRIESMSFVGTYWRKIMSNDLEGTHEHDEEQTNDVGTLIQYKL